MQQHEWLIKNEEKLFFQTSENGYHANFMQQRDF